MKSYVVEVVGTFFLAMAVGIAGLAGNVLAIGLMLMAMMYIGGHISGGHYNPAVSSAVWLRGALATKDMIGYKLAQVIGALLAGALFYLLMAVPMVITSEGPLLVGLFHEAFLAFVLCSVFLTLATMDRFKATGIVALAIGLTLVALISLHGVVNPAIGVCSLVCNLFKGNSAGAIDNAVVHIAGPLVGSVVSALWFRYLNPSEARHSII